MVAKAVVYRLFIQYRLKIASVKLILMLDLATNGNINSIMGIAPVIRYKVNILLKQKGSYVLDGDSRNNIAIKLLIIRWKIYNSIFERFFEHGNY